MNYKRTVGFGYDKLINKYGLDSLKSLKKYNQKKSIKKYTFVKNYLLNDQRVQSILEIGSGSGLFLKFIRKKKNIDYTGIESSKKFFTYLKKNFKFKNFNFINSTFPEDPSIIKKFDVIFSLNSIQQKNYKNSDSIKFIKKFVKRSYKLFKERKDREGIVEGGGSGRVSPLLIFDFFIKDKVDFYDKEFNYYSKNQIIKLFKKQFIIKFYNVINSEYECICVMKLRK